MIRAYLVTAPLIVLATVVLGTASVAGSLVDPNGRFQHACARVWSRFIVSVSGIDLVVRRADGFHRDGRYVICANHQSHMDIPVLLAALPMQFRFTAKKELFRIPFLGWHLRRAGHFPIDREHPRTSARALERSADQIRQGVSLAVFPEGGTSRTGHVGSFKRGGFLIAEHVGFEVLPVTISGTRDILPPGSHRVRNGTVTVTIHAPVPSNTLSVNDLVDAVRTRIVEGAAP
jgi:1-acyl-sn-glycerol-3-phosphate acyltransferase